MKEIVRWNIVRESPEDKMKDLLDWTEGIREKVKHKVSQKLLLIIYQIINQLRMKLSNIGGPDGFFGFRKPDIKYFLHLAIIVGIQDTLC